MKKCALVLVVLALALVSAGPSSFQKGPREWQADRQRELSSHVHSFNARLMAENADLDLRVKVIEQKMAALLKGESPEKVREIHADDAALKNVLRLRRQAAEVLKADPMHQAMEKLEKERKLKEQSPAPKSN